MAIIVYDEIFLEHDTGKHPECAERLANTVQHLHSTGLWDECTIHTPREATVEELEAVHFPAHVKKVREMSAVRSQKGLSPCVTRDCPFFHRSI